jgi:hypothetical protein
MAADRRDLIPQRVRTALREAVGGQGIYTLGLIGNLFEAEGFQAAPDTSPDPLPESRREYCERFHTAIEWTSTDHAQRYLNVVERVIEEYETELRESPLPSPGYERRVARLRSALAQSGISVDSENRLRLPNSLVGMRMAGVPTESDIRMHAARLARLDQEPEETIGAAKELVEATAKHVLMTLGRDFDPKADVAAVSKAALKALNLHRDAIAPTVRGAEVITKMLTGLQQIAVGLAELRNAGYGTGHGRGTRISGIKSRHADFVARSAVAYTEMVLDTLHDEDAPWRES